jgi:hypothetical protein
MKVATWFLPCEAGEGDRAQRGGGGAARNHQCCVLGKVKTAPDLMPSGQRVVTVFRRV